MPVMLPVVFCHRYANFLEGGKGYFCKKKGFRIVIGINLVIQYRSLR